MTFWADAAGDLLELWSLAWKRACVIFRPTVAALLISSHQPSAETAWPLCEKVMKDEGLDGLGCWQSVETAGEENEAHVLVPPV